MHDPAPGKHATSVQVGGTPARGLARVRAALPPYLWLLLLGTGVALCFFGTPLWWLGAALGLASLAALHEAERSPLRVLLAFLAKPRKVRGRTLRLDHALLEVAYVAAIVAVGLVMMRDVVLGGRPVSHDHTVHFYKAWELHTHFVPEGRLLGWSQRMFAGQPTGYLYPIGADLWVNAVYALGFGAFSFSRAYGIALIAFHVFTGLSTYAFTRVLTRSAMAGVLAALGMMTDLSVFRLGGWAYTIEYGVWPQALGLNFALVALCALPALAMRRTLAPIGWFGLFFGCAIISHPILITFLVYVVLAAALAMAFAPGVRAMTGLARLGVAVALGVLVSAVWFLPFWSTRGDTDVMGLYWEPAYELGKGLLELNALEGTLGYVLAFGVLGVALALRSRRLGSFFVASVALLVPATVNSTFLDELHLTALSGSLLKIQYMRIGALAKPFWFAVAAYAAVVVISRARELVQAYERVSAGTTPNEDAAAASAPVYKPSSPLRNAMLAGLVALATLPIVVPAGQSFWNRYVRKTLVTDQTHPERADRVQLEQWLLQNLPKDGFYRVGVFSGHFHDLMDLPALLDKPMWKRGFTPAANFIYKMKDNKRSILEAVNLRFAVSKRPLQNEDFELIREFGVYKLYRFRHYRPEPFQILEGAGDVQMQRFDDEEVLLKVAPGAHGRLRLNVSYFSRWHAYRNGQPVPLSITYLRDSPETTGFMTVPLAPGIYRFAFERTWSDRLAAPLSVLGLLVCLALALADRGLRGVAWLTRAHAWCAALLDRASDARFALPRRVLLALAVLGAAGVFVALAVWTPKLELERLGPIAVSEVKLDFLEALPKARARIDYATGSRFCSGQGDHKVCRDERGNLRTDYWVGSLPTQIETYRMQRCIRARPVERGNLVITYPRVPAGDAIVGYYGIESAGRLMLKRRPVRFSVRVDGRVQHDEVTRSDNHTHWFKVPVGRQKGNVAVEFAVRADNVSKRWFCFYAQMANLETSHATPAGGPSKDAPGDEEEEEEAGEDAVVE